MNRSAGILMPVFALPSPHGIGTLGKAAFAFADFLSAAGQSYWQVLPAGPTGFGDSPYQSFSSFAGNPYFIDLDTLCEDGLLTSAEIASGEPDKTACRVDYGKQYEKRFPLLEKAFARGKEKYRDAFASFCSENEKWLSDYALFMALKEHFENRPWYMWEEDIRFHRQNAVSAYRSLLKERVDFYSFLQFLFAKQWTAFRSYVNALGISLIGDIPIYVSEDSADVWANPGEFDLDEMRRPIHIAGVPPDYFSKDGQRWGNPLYRWDVMKQNGYRFWIERIGAAKRLFDVIRIDHFRAFSSYWSIPAKEKTAKNGVWQKGPGMDFIGMILGWFSDLPIIAEDLGDLTPDVYDLLKESGLPGMKVLEFAFDGNPENEYLPHSYPKNCVCYLGTHDNNTALGWLSGIDTPSKTFATQYLGLNKQEGFVWGLLRAGLSSPANLFVAQMQDYLELDAQARMNTPGKADGNWEWRLPPDALSDSLAKKIRSYTEMYGRLPHKKEELQT